MTEPARTLFEGLSTWGALQQLIDTGEAENQLLECKGPTSPQVNQGIKAKLGEALSGFANSGGGVIAWGLRTEAHQGLDVVAQLQPIGAISSFKQQIDRGVPTVIQPALDGVESRLVKESSKDTKGALLTYVPPSPGDPIRSAVDEHFYLRAGDAFVRMPYELVRRMFMGSAGPDLSPVFNSGLVTVSEGVWRIPVAITNESSAAARDVQVSVEVVNPEAVETVRGIDFQDTSDINLGRRLFMSRLEWPVYRGTNRIAGYLEVVMNRGKRPRRVLLLRVSIFADRMRAQEWVMKVHLASTGFTVRKTESQFLY